MSNKVVMVQRVRAVEDATLFNSPYWQPQFTAWCQLCNRLESPCTNNGLVGDMGKYLAALKALRALCSGYEEERLLVLDARVGRAILGVNITREQEQRAKAA